MTKIVEKTRELGYVRTLFNRKREIEEIKNTNYLIRIMGDRMALNTPIQGSSADIIKIAMIRVHDRLINEGFVSRLILQVHDELIVECKEADREKVCDILINKTLSAAKEYGFEGNLVVGANVAGFLKVAEAMLAEGVAY